MGTLTASMANNRPSNSGSLQRFDTTVAFGTSYNNTGSDLTTGETLTAASVGLSRIRQVVFNQDEGTGYGFSVLYSPSGAEQVDPSSVRVKVFASAGGAGTTGATSGGTPAGTNGTSAVTGTGTGTVTPLGTNGTSAVTAQTFTPAATAGDLNLATPAFSGTGLTAAGQVMTTTDNQTMTLNQCAGMWLIPATGSSNPMLILSNTAVAAAPAVFTVQGTAATDAGAYKVVRVLTSGTNSTSTAAAQTFTGSSSVVTVSALTATAAAQTFTGSALSTHTHTIAAGGGGEVANGTNLNAAGLTAVQVTIYGY